MRLAFPFALVASVLLVTSGYRWEALPWIAAAAAAGHIVAEFRGYTGISFMLVMNVVWGAQAGFLMIAAGGPLLIVIGAVGGILATPVLALLVFASELAPARRGSLMDGAAIRRTWLLAAFLFVSFIRLHEIVHPRASDAPAMISGASLMVLLTLIDALQLLTLRHWRHDIGIGERRYQLTAPNDPYRGSARMVLVEDCWQRAEQVLLRQVVFDFVVTMLSLWQALPSQGTSTAP
jgi:hypothetical protein